MIHIGEIDITRKVSGGQLYKPNFSGEIEIPVVREKKKLFIETSSNNFSFKVEITIELCF